MSFMLRIGNWMLDNRGLHRLQRTFSRGKQKASGGGDKQLRVGTASNSWWQWKRIL